MKPAAMIISSSEPALLFAHEMDAVRKQEWKMFIVLKDMKNEKAYLVFLSLQIPLYTAVLMLLFHLFLILHFILLIFF